MRKDDHLIFEAFSQQRVMGDEQAAKLIADKIKGTPNLNIQNIKMYVSKYLGMVGKAPNDVDHISAYVLDILNSQGMAENAEDMSKWDRGNYVIDLQGNIIGEFLGNSDVSELKIGNDVKHLNSGYAETINWGTHIGLWSRNKRHRLVLRNPDKWNEFFSGLDNKSEQAEDMSESPFHYDPMHGLASAAHKIRDELRGAANDEARPEHIEKMAEIILGPQSEYASVDHYKKALSGVIELLNHYVVVPMNEYEEEKMHPDEKKYGEMLRKKQEDEYKFRDWLNKQRAEGKARNYPQKAPYEVKPHWRKKEENAEMPTKQFMSLKQFINKGPIQVKTPKKELPSTHKEIHPLVKQDPREGHRDEEAESACIEDLANKHGVSLEDITHQLEMGLKIEMEHTEDMNIAKKIALDHLTEDPHYYTKLAKMEGKGENAEDEGELMTHMKQTGMIPKGSKPTVGPHTTRERRSENEERRLDPKCWKGYHKQGTKLKGGKRVNNCVKNS